MRASENDQLLGIVHDEELQVWVWKVMVCGYNDNAWQHESTMVRLMRETRERPNDPSGLAGCEMFDDEKLQWFNDRTRKQKRWYGLSYDELCRP
jgi:hypothetical protein